MKKRIRTMHAVKIPTWAMSYLVNGDDSALDEDDKATIDTWVERTRNGGSVHVHASDGEPYFCSCPAFGLACDVEDCDVVVDMSPWYPQNPCIRFGQSRFGPVKRRALDGRVWWCMYDYRKKEYVSWYKFTKRKRALAHLSGDLRRNDLPYEPDPGFSRDWLLSRTVEEIRDLMNRREPPWVEASRDR